MNDKTPSKDAVAQAIKDLILCLLEAIKEAGQIPDGHLYAQVMQYVGFETYSMAIDILVESGRVKKVNHMLIWVK